MGIAVNAISAEPISDLGFRPPGSGGGGAGLLYDEITLQEWIVGAVILQEYATANVLLNEHLSSFRSVNSATVLLQEAASAEASLRESLMGIATIFEH